MCGESKDESAPNSYTNGATERARCAPRALARCSIYSPLCTGTPANIRHSLRKRKGLPLVGTRTVIHDYGSLHFSFFYSYKIVGLPGTWDSQPAAHLPSQPVQEIQYGVAGNSSSQANLFYWTRWGTLAFGR